MMVKIKKFFRLGSVNHCDTCPSKLQEPTQSQEGYWQDGGQNNVNFEEKGAVENDYSSNKTKVSLTQFISCFMN